MKYFRIYSGVVRFTLLVDSDCRVEGFMGSMMRSIGVVQGKDHESQREIIVLGIIVLGIERKERTPSNLGK